MKKVKYFLLSIFFSFHYEVFASDPGILKGIGSGSGGVSKIRSGDIHTDDIPKIVQGTIDYLMGFAATISIIFIIIGAYKIVLGSIDGDGKADGKKTIFYALGGFVLASLSWLILKLIIDNFS